MAKRVTKKRRAAPARKPRTARPRPGKLGAIQRLTGEPWVDIADGRALARWGKPQEIEYNQGNRQAAKLEFFQRTFDFLNENEIRGDYHEYGCHRCRTFRMALTEARRHNLGQMKFWAFDSFEGLPDPATATSVSKWTRGALTTSEQEFVGLVRKHGIYADKVKTIRGFYSDTLTPQLQSQLQRDNRIALVTVDCDLYESAVPVFNFIEPLLQDGSVIYLDDLFVGNKGNPNSGIARAFLEFQQRSRWRFLRHLDISWWGRSYIVYDGGAPSGVL